MIRGRSSRPWLVQVGRHLELRRDAGVLVDQLDRALLPALAAHCRTMVRETRDHGAPLLLLAWAER